MIQPNQTYIDQYINDGLTAVLSMKNFYNTILTSDINDQNNIIKIPISDFFVKYRNQLENSIQWYNLPEKFFYKPKSVSLELYGTTELWLSLLRLNCMINITDFYLPIIKVYNPGDIKEYINIFFKREGKIT